jgi:hypothetical protein
MHGNNRPGGSVTFVSKRPDFPLHRKSSGLIRAKAGMNFAALCTEMREKGARDTRHTRCTGEERGTNRQDRTGLIKPKQAISVQTMKVFGIYILTDRTLRILLQFARNTELNEIAYREILDKGTRIELSVSSPPESLYLLPSSCPPGASSPHRSCSN